MGNYTYNNLKEEYAQMWENMVTNPSARAKVKKQGDLIIKNKDRYLSLEQKTNVPWYMIGVIHLRESGCDFKTHLHNGDPLSARTVHEPIGYPKKGTPPFSFEYSAIDALTIKGYTKISNWNIEQIAFCLEKYNGFGYRNYGVSSPYLWGSTNQYIKGKYVSDHNFSPNVVDTQVGCMAVLKYIFYTENIDEPKEIPEPAITPTADIERPTTKEMNKVSTKHWWTDWLQWIGLGGAGGTALQKAAENSDVETIQNVAQQTHQIAMLVGATGIVVLFLGIVIYAMYMKKKMKDDVQQGRATPSMEQP